jgi:sterol desaturase/sphingolipid hydroxylase (fatty acid hydroxylase superfamily)
MIQSIAHWTGIAVEHLTGYVEAILAALGPHKSNSFLSYVRVTAADVLNQYAVFFLIGALIFARSVQRGVETCSFRALLNYLLPASIYRHTSFKVDLVAFPIEVTLRYFIFAALALSASSVQSWLLRLFGQLPLTIPNGGAAISLQVIILYLAADFARFLWHYQAHKIPVFWDLHHAHHSAEVLHPVAVRIHPLDRLIEYIYIGIGGGLIAGTLIYLGGMQLSPTAAPFIAGLGVVLGILAGFQHSQIWISYGSAINRVFYSPCMHLVHHSALLRHRDKNLGQVGGLALWDYLFGTLYIPKSREEFPFGSDISELGSNNPHQSLAQLYVRPVKAALQTLRARAQRYRSPRHSDTLPLNVANEERLEA